MGNNRWALSSARGNSTLDGLWAFQHLASAPSTTSEKQSQASDWDVWWISRLPVWYRRAQAIKCPFMSRRVSDVLDTLDTVLRNGLIQQPSLMGRPLAYRCETDFQSKLLGLSLIQLADEIEKDWRQDTKKGYYITGKLNKVLYRDDCLFDGPDPDMPVRGLRKYLNAASHLFDPRESTCDLLSLTVETSVVVARWRMQGTLRLPWRPTMPVVMGTTTYHTDGDGLVRLHEETWDVSVFQAFLQTFWPGLAHRLWKNIDDSLSEKI
jgi:hypothetical protein